MASSSPVSISNIGDSIIAITAINGNTTPQQPGSYEMPKPSLRGLNKPKCIKCGNVARSRCPFQSCKSCCAKAENPCHIHVLKQNGILPDKPPVSSSISVEQPSNDVSTTGASWRLNSLRQLSNNFANILRTKRPLTRKDATDINQWRFMKLREHFEQNIEAENEALDRYMENVDLLEETLSIMEGTEPGHQTRFGPSSSENLVSEIKMKLKADSERVAVLRERIWDLIDQKLSKLRDAKFIHVDSSTYVDDLDDHEECQRSKKTMKWRHERSAAMTHLINKLSRAESDEDLRSCLDMKSQLSDQMDIVADASSNLRSENQLMTKQESESVVTLSFHSLSKMSATVYVDEDTLGNIKAQFSSLSQIAEL
ncbi:unnamed protein product [Musa acuminata subsp. malaccensis]|uniref:(wild Malaysian banana) hypothetical protein n=1 Tax=Musa acuminata subsp. malaccensis TaxID=214687 RepID=A0A804I4R7_MUSAM|nr:PREDICTED: uncharacterized protein LOC103975125 isoform X2 [Musa acuminata subsp. malaccensis]CAG1862592.1 unnamed protein product [Musa acuminata subsp. malaccensis]